MRFNKGFLMFLVCGLIGFFSFTTSSEAKSFKYVGVDKCKKCHKKKDEGAQYDIWKKSKLSKAFETLKSDKAAEVAKKAGITGNASESPECLACHVTAFGVDKKSLDKKFNVEDGVQCEACHGPGEKYASKKPKKEIPKLRKALAKLKEGTPEYAKVAADLKKERDGLVALGMTYPEEKACKICHAAEITVGGKTYKNPSWDPAKGFDFEKAKKDIAHPRLK
ncbi:cytochrome c family protein [Deltaproteobacteria bacterium TL4]